jgi:hypothetical protein
MLLTNDLKKTNAILRNTNQVPAHYANQLAYTKLDFAKQTPSSAQII